MLMTGHKYENISEGGFATQICVWENLEGMFKTQ